MTAQTIEKSSSFSFVGMILLLFVLGIAMASTSTILFGSHAVERHGSEAWMVRDCIVRFGPVMRLYNPDTKRWADVCEVDDGLYGVQITEQVNGRREEVTSFLKTKSRTLEQVLRYLRNRGYRIMTQGGLQ